MKDRLFLGNVQVRATEARLGTGEEVRRISGVASTASVDRAYTRVNQDALKRVVDSLAGRSIKAFWNHNWSVPIGYYDHLESKDGKLYFDGTIGQGFPVPVEVRRLRRGRRLRLGFSASWVSSASGATAVAP